MHAAITAATAGRGSRDELQAAAREFVRELRAKEQTPEGALIQIKTVLAAAGLRPTYMSADLEDKLGIEAKLYRDVIGWSIKAYYEDGRSGG
jgi:hypothetical protein